MKDFYVVLACGCLSVLFAFGMAKYSTVQAQSESIKTSTRYISGHSYILFTNNDSISVVHDEACFSRSHGR